MVVNFSKTESLKIKPLRKLIGKGVQDRKNRESGFIRVWIGTDKKKKKKKIKKIQWDILGLEATGCSVVSAGLAPPTPENTFHDFNRNGAVMQNYLKTIGPVRLRYGRRSSHLILHKATLRKKKTG